MESSTELRDVITRWFDAVTKGDTSWVDQHVSTAQGARLIGTDPSEWLAGAQVAEFLRKEAAGIGGGATLTLESVEAYQEGTVGWGVARPKISFAGGQTLVPRWGAVFHQEDGVWKLVQLHASVGIGNDEVGFESRI